MVHSLLDRRRSMRDERLPRPLKMPLGEAATVPSSGSSNEDVAALLDQVNHNGKLAQVSSGCSLDSLDQVRSHCSLCVRLLN